MLHSPLKPLLATAVAAGALFAATSARAGDLPPPPLPVAPPIEQPCCGTEPGWYLRGDISVGANTTDKHRITTSPAANAAGGVIGYNDDLGTTVSGGVGVGYAVNSWLRFDGTVEYRGGGSISSVDYYTSTFGTPPVTSNGADFYKANLYSVVGLANAYVDLGTWYCLTPYIGGGVGVAYNHVGGFTDNGFSYPGGNVAGAYFREGSKTNFAWALMAGVAYDVAPNLKLDLGYRYLNIGDAQTGYSVAPPSLGTGTSYKYTQKDIASHEVRLGMRWVFAEKSAPALGYSEPLVRKY